MIKYDFDKITNRTNTACLKYDFAVERGHAADVLPFWVADMDFPGPKEVIDELVLRSQHGIFGYTDVKKDYVDVLMEWFKNRHDWQPKDDSLVVTPGVVYAICSAVRSLTEPGDAVLIQRPVYYPFSLAIKQNKRRLINNPLLLKDGHYEIDFEDFEKKIVENKVKLFILCSPHNPVGRVWSRDELEKIGTICLKHHVVVVADEIHEEFVRPGNKHSVFASIKPEFAEIAITCTAPSKSFNLAGLQISNIFIENKDIKKRFTSEMYASGYSQPNALGLFAAKAAYQHGGEWLDQLTSYLEANLQKTKAFLQDELPLVKLIEPEGTYLIWLDFSAYGLSDEKINKIIKEKAKLWLDEGEIFGPEGQGFQRINTACPWATLEKGLLQLKTAFAAL